MRSVKPLARLPLLAMFLLAGCGSGKPADKPASPESTAAQLAQPPEPSQPPEPPKPGNGSAISDKVGETEFSYRWPQVAANIPDLDSWLHGNGERLRRETMDSARDDEAQAKKAGYPFRGHSYEEEWGVAADLPALLVMQSEGYVFTGGAHGMPIVTTLLWDKAAKKRLATSALLDTPALITAIKDRFCKALDAERAKRRGAPVDAKGPDQLADFVRCVDLAKQTILPVSAKGTALDTIRVVIMPYEAGPYSEGIYQIDLPVDAAVLASVKPAWRGSFSAR
jgi:hypothetical protein